jgi:small subunit ribosomal protein S20
MANHRSALKKERQIKQTTLINRSRLSRVRTFIKKVEMAIQSGNKSEAQQALILAQPEMMRAVSRGILHKNTVSRKLSRLSSHVKALS